MKADDILYYLKYLKGRSFTINGSRDYHFTTLNGPKVKIEWLRTGGTPTSYSHLVSRIKFFINNGIWTMLPDTREELTHKLILI